MRIVYLDSLKPGDIEGFYDKKGVDDHPFSLRNCMGHTVHFMKPKLQMTLTRGVIIVDEECNRNHRSFGYKHSTVVTERKPHRRTPR